jgi:hypothetical protein
LCRVMVVSICNQSNAEPPWRSGQENMATREAEKGEHVNRNNQTSTGLLTVAMHSVTTLAL